MVPVTPSPRRRVGYLGNRNRSSSVSSTSVLASPPRRSTSGARTPTRLGLSPPPLYHHQNGITTNESSLSPSPTTTMMVLSDKRGNRVGLSSRSSHTFRPVVVPRDEQQASSMMMTPPTSPFQRYSHVVTCSPSPSLVSTATTPTAATTAETWSDATMTPRSSLSSSASSFCSVSPSPTYFPFYRPPGTNHRDDTRSPRKSSGSYNASSKRRSSSSTTSSPSSVATAYSTSTNRESDETSRKQRVKTEMCMHYSSGKPCPFGANCTYAHGEEELQMTKLVDLHRAGLIDMDTYRTNPCLTWVTTGSCPFGIRCTGIHDARIAGSTPSWLPHTETQGNSINTDINVDGLHQKRLNAILYGNPFGDKFSLEIDDFGDLYKLICNTNIMKRRRNTLSELHKLSIALQMRGAPGWMYKFRPQHVIFSSLCMVLQKRAFRLDKGSQAIEIPLTSFNSKCSTHVLVREIAFGPDSDTTVRGVALWFNIPESEVGECTVQQAKRFRWKKGPKQDERNLENAHNKIFDSRECFFMIRPHDKDAFDLTTNILKHRLQTVEHERKRSLSDRFEALKVLQKEKEALCKTFRNQRRHWISWQWPINTGRQTVEDDTPVPSIDGPYQPLVDRDNFDFDGEDTPVAGNAIQSIWDSFVSTDFSEDVAEPENYPTEEKDRKRLAIFEQLAQGDPVSEDRSNPHLIFSRVVLSTTEAPTHRQSERCWQALLLKQTGVYQANNEWEVVRGHFQNSRSKKVLSILQQ